MTFKELTREHINNQDIFSKLEKYVEMIEEKNKVMNLTGFKGDRLWEEGIYESIVSLESAFEVINGAKLLDIGAGAGFPSVPFIIAHPEIKLTIFESQSKRVIFLKEVSSLLELNIDVQNQRVEKSEMIEYFDLITARAVSELKALIEASSQLGKLNAKYAFVKGPKVHQELKNSQTIIKELGISIEIKKVNSIKTKDIFIAEFEKKQVTPSKFPRDWSTIVK